MQQVCLFLCNYFSNVCQPDRSRKLAYAGCPLPACFKRYVNVAMLLVPLSSLRWADDFRRRRGYLEVIVLLVLGSNRCSVRLLSKWGRKEVRISHRTSYAHLLLAHSEVVSHKV